jgi:pyruvate dehydrogenase E2 component (dihydrolipoamide acetyltransferase)
MAEILEMPKLSDTMVEGVVVAWHKNIGDTVETGELLAEIETDKATMELESFFDGVLLHREVEENGVVPVGQLLCVIGEKGEDVKAILANRKTAKVGASAETAAPPAEEESAPVAETSSAAASSAAPATSDNGNGRVKASPLAKAMAKDKGISLDAVTGSGPEGRIIKRDVEDFKESAKPAAASTVSGTEGYDDQPLSQMRKTIARRLTESKNAAPHFYLTMEIDMSNSWEGRKALNETSPVKLSFNDLIIKAVAMALRQHPGVNSSWMGDAIRHNHHINVGMAVAVDKGLIVPVIRHADNRSLSQISAEARRLAELARDGKLQPEDYTGSTFTISNLGMFGIEQFTAIINAPDACILAVGAIRDVPVVKNGAVVPGKTMHVTMSCDHRVVDGAVGAAYLVTLKELLENPLRMMI